MDSLILSKKIDRAEAPPIIIRYGELIVPPFWLKTTKILSIASSQSSDNYHTIGTTSAIATTISVNPQLCHIVH